MKIINRKRIVYLILLAIIVLCFLYFLSRKDSTRTITLTDYLDTVCNITVISDSEKPLEEIEDYLKFADKEFSAEDENSTLFKLNNHKELNLSDDLSDAISIGDEFTKKHPEYFSIYLDDLIKLWNINESPDKIPSYDEIQVALSNQDKINLGGVAKGYITDEMVEKLQEHGVKSALINLGGNTYAMGKKPSGENWRIGIQSPADESSVIGSIVVENLAVVTSGDYQRYVEIDGVYYHHIFDPKTGYPADSGVHSVTVICENATLADILSTAAFVAGVEDGQKLLESYDALGIFVTDDTVYLSKELENTFKQADTSYKYEFLD